MLLSFTKINFNYIIYHRFLNVVLNFTARDTWFTCPTLFNFTCLAPNFKSPTQIKMKLLLVLLLYTYCKAQTFDTNPIQNEGEDKIIVEANIGDTGVEIYCKVTSSNIVTTWEVEGTILDFDIYNGSITSQKYSYFSVASDLTSEATLSIIEPFATEHDRLEVICRTGDPNGNKKIFLFGIPGTILIPSQHHIINYCRFIFQSCSCT